MAQFFYEGNLEKVEEIVFSPDESRHLKVFRARKGDKIKVFDLYGHQRYAIISQISDKCFKAIVSEKIQKKEKKIFLSLYFPFIEKNAFEEILRKSCEVGVDRVIPIITQYTQRNFVFNLNSKKERLKSILISAVKQCERQDLPVVEESRNFNDILDDDGQDFIVLSKYDCQDNLTVPFVEVLKKTGSKINIVVGPEGGFSKRELEMAGRKALLAYIGENVMKTQTAAIAACAIARAIKYEDLL